MHECALGWLGTMWSLSVIDKYGEDVKRLREQRLGDRVIKRVNKFVANAFLGFLAQCALPFYAFLSHSKDLEIFFTTFKIQASV